MTDENLNRVQKFTDTGAFVTEWGSTGAGDGQFNHPRGLAVDAASNVYVADTYNHRIQVFNNSGVYLTQWGTGGTGDGQFGSGQFDGPSGVALDVSGNIYVADDVNHRVQKFGPMLSTPTHPTSWGNLKSLYR